MKRRIAELITGQVVHVGLQGLLNIYVARELGPSDKGLFSLVIVFALLSAAFWNLGVSHASAYFVRNKPESSKYVFINILISITLTFLGTMAVLYFAEGLLKQYIFDETKLSWNLSLLTIGLTITSSCILNLGASIISIGNSKGYGVSLNIGSIISLTLTLLLFQFWQKDIHAALLSFFVGQSITSLFFASKFIAYYKQFTSQRLDQKSFLQFSLKAYGGSLSSIFFKRADLYVINYFLSFHEVGLYSVALSLKDLALIVPRAISGLIGGEVADNKEKDINKKISLLKTSINYSLVLNAITLVMGILMFPYLIPIIFGVEYEESIVLAQIVITSIVPFSIAIILGGFINGVGKPELLSLGNFCASLFTLGSMFYFISQYGTIGAAISSVAGASILLTIIFLMFTYVKQKSRQSKF